MALFKREPDDAFVSNKPLRTPLGGPPPRNVTMAPFDPSVNSATETPAQTAARRGVSSFLTQHADYTLPINKYVARDWLYDWAHANADDPDFPKLYAFYVIEVWRLNREYVPLHVLAETMMLHWSPKRMKQRVDTEVAQYLEK